MKRGRKTRKAAALTAAATIALTLGGCTIRDALAAPEPAPEPTIHAPRTRATGSDMPLDSLALETPMPFTSPSPTPTTTPTPAPAPALEFLAATVTQDDEQPEQEREPEREYLGTYTVVGYDTCAACCGWTAGITASGTQATVGRTVAMNGIPFGTTLYIEGIGERIVEDRGGMADGVIDVLCENHAACYAITGRYEVYKVIAPEDTP